MGRKNKAKKVEKKPQVGLVSKILASGALALAGIGIGYYALRASPEEVIARKAEAESLPKDYVEDVVRVGNDYSKRDIYFLFQVHGLSGHSMESYLGKKAAGEVVEDIKNDSRQNQVSIYRILDSLCSQSKIGLVSVEGIYHTDTNTPGSFEKRLGSERMNRLREEFRSDSFLEKKLDDSFAGAEWAAAILGNLYLSGWEDANHNKDSSELLKDLMNKRAVWTFYDSCKNLPVDIVVEQLLNRGYSQQQASDLRVQLIRLKANPQEAEKLAEEIKEMGKKFEALQVLRSLDALNYSVLNADRLYAEGKIKTRNIAVVIGGYHRKHYEEIVRRNEAQSNFIFVSPKGLGKSMKK